MNIMRWLRRKIMEHTFQPIREVFMMISLAFLAFGWLWLSENLDKKTEAAWWNTLVMAILSEAYAKDD